MGEYDNLFFRRISSKVSRRYTEQYWLGRNCWESYWRWNWWELLELVSFTFNRLTRMEASWKTVTRDNMIGHLHKGLFKLFFMKLWIILKAHPVQDERTEFKHKYLSAHARTLAGMKTTGGWHVLSWIQLSGKWLSTTEWIAVLTESTELRLECSKLHYPTIPSSIVVPLASILRQDVVEKNWKKYQSSVL